LSIWKPALASAHADDSPLFTPEALGRMSDQEVITEWSKTTCENGDRATDALAAEVEQRGLEKCRRVVLDQSWCRNIQVHSIIAGFSKSTSATEGNEKAPA
jgi:hypothetical protein